MKAIPADADDLSKLNVEPVGSPQPPGVSVPKPIVTRTPMFVAVVPSAIGRVLLSQYCNPFAAVVLQTFVGPERTAPVVSLMSVPDAALGRTSIRPNGSSRFPSANVSR